MINGYLSFLQETGLGPGDRPKGWTSGSVKKAGVTMAKNMGLESPADKNFVDKCIEKVKDHMKSPEAYCASLKDRYTGSTFWRGKGKGKKEGDIDIARHQNV